MKEWYTFYTFDDGICWCAIDNITETIEFCHIPSTDDLGFHVYNVSIIKNKSGLLFLKACTVCSNGNDYELYFHLDKSLSEPSDSQLIAIPRFLSFSKK